jgi:hypothetical protein
LFPGDDMAGVAEGRISVAFRRWARPRVVAGRVYRTNAARLLVESIEPVDPDAISVADAKAAGRPDPEAVRRSLRGADGDPVYRIVFRPAPGPDPRADLAADDRLDPAARDDVVARLARLDRASRSGPWTHAVLRCIAERPGVRAADLAASFGRETAPFKLDVRKLKALGLTLSLEVGYRLSPRGEAYLRDSSGLPER